MTSVEFVTWWYGRGNKLSNTMAATERRLPERARSQKEGHQRAGEHKRCVMLQAREQKTVGSNSSKALAVPANQKVLKHMRIL